MFDLSSTFCTAFFPFTVTGPEHTFILIAIDFCAAVWSINTIYLATPCMTRWYQWSFNVSFLTIFTPSFKSVLEYRKGWKLFVKYEPCSWHLLMTPACSPLQVSSQCPESQERELVVQQDPLKILVAVWHCAYQSSLPDKSAAEG